MLQLNQTTKITFSNRIGKKNHCTILLTLKRPVPWKPFFCNYCKKLPKGTYSNGRNEDFVVSAMLPLVCLLASMLSPWATKLCLWSFKLYLLSHHRWNIFLISIIWRKKHEIWMGNCPISKTNLIFLNLLRIWFCPRFLILCKVTVAIKKILLIMGAKINHPKTP